LYGIIKVAVFDKERGVFDTQGSEFSNEPSDRMDGIVVMGFAKG
jgi:hypothetical protein